MIRRGIGQAARLLLGLLLLLSCSLAVPANAERTVGAMPCIAQSGHGPAPTDEQFVIGRVKSLTQMRLNEELKNSTGIESHGQEAEIEVLEGPLKGKTFGIHNELTDNPAYNVTVRPGQEVVLSVVTDGGGTPEINIADYHRAPYLLWLCVVFLAAFLFFGGKQGLKSLAGLLVCVALVVWVLLPLSLRGFDPLIAAIFICLAATASCMFFVAGLSRKAWAATIGTIGGIIIAGVAAELVIVGAALTGLSSEEAQILRGSVLAQPAEFYSGLLAAGMLIGALGVIMDVGMSVSSAVSEVSNQSDNLTSAELYKSGMNVGRDIMGTMTNTLVLAYAGGALPLLLLVAQMPSIKLLNLDLVATEVTAALAGSLGLVCTIPLTAFTAAKLMARESRGP